MKKDARAHIDNFLIMHLTNNFVPFSLLIFTFFVFFSFFVSLL